MTPTRMAAAAILLFWTIACSHGTAENKAVPSPVIPVRVLPAAAAVGAESFATGAISAVHSVDIRAETTGSVASVTFKDGDIVQKGQVLATLRDEVPKATLKAAEARFVLAKSRLDRVTRLRSNDNVSQADLEVAQAELDLALADVALAEDSIRRTRIRAPFAGTLGRRLVDVGDQIDSARIVTQIDDIKTLAVDLSWPERHLSQLALGQQVFVDVDAWPETFIGVVAYIAPRVDPDTRTLTLRALLDNKNGKLRPGMTARVRQSLGQADGAVSVPTQAVLVGANGPSVYVVGDDNKVVLRPLRLGGRTAELVEVREGLEAGERVVVEGLLRLRPGALVSVQTK